MHFKSKLKKSKEKRRKISKEKGSFKLKRNNDLNRNQADMKLYKLSEEKLFITITIRFQLLVAELVRPKIRIISFLILKATSKAQIKRL